MTVSPMPTATSAITFGRSVREALGLPLLNIPPLPFEISQEAQDDRNVWISEVITGTLRIIEEAEAEQESIRRLTQQQQGQQQRDARQ
jgi:hypothetical protein